MIPTDPAAGSSGDHARAGQPRARVLGLAPGGWALTLAGVHALLALLLYDPTLFTGGDNAGYMILGDALRSGRGYRDIYLPDAPLHTRYPPGYPVILAVLGWLGGLQLFKLFSLACTTASVWLLYRLGCRLTGAWTAVVAAGVFAVNPVLLEYSHFVLSEAPFLCLVLLSLTAYAAGPRSVAGRPRATAALALGTAVGAYLVRSAGVPLLAAAVLHHALRRRWKAMGWTAAGGGAVILGWSLLQRTGGAGESYFRQLVMRNPYDPAAGTVDVAGLVARAARNLWTYAVDTLPQSLAGTVGGGEPGALGTVAGLAVALLALGGWLARSERELGVGELFFPLYVGLILLWPEEWTDRRFLLPVLPLVLLYALHGVRAGVRRLGDVGGEGGRHLRFGVGLVALAVVVPAALSATRLVPERARCLTSYWRDRPCVTPAWSSFYGAAEWAAANTPESAVFMNRKPRIFYWLSGRRGDVYPYSRNADVVMERLMELGADYVVVDPLFGTTRVYLVPAIQAHRARFETVYSGGEPPTLVLRHRSEPPAAMGPAESGTAASVTASAGPASHAEGEPGPDTQARGEPGPDPP